jgi:hypothetical protein
LGELGWNTYMVGKWHLCPDDEMNLASTRRNWPSGRGFERWYGFLGAETNQWYPDLVYDNHQVGQYFYATVNTNVAPTDNKLLRQASDMAAEYRVIRSGAKRPRGVGTTTTSFYETPLRCPVCGSGRERGQTYCREHVGSPEAKQGEALIVRVDDDA